MKKILFVTIASGNKTGGHLYSLYHISNEIAKSYDIRILTLGDEPCIVYENTDIYLSNCKIANISNILKLNSNIKNKLNGFDPDIVHCYDERALLFMSKIKLFNKKKIILTKCGGRNPIHSNWIYADNIVLFSQENYDWMISNRHYSKANLYLIPNRVKKTSLLPLEKRIFDKDIHLFNIVRIMRICEYYKNGVINLFDFISDLGLQQKVKVYIIGRIENNDTKEELMNVATRNGINIHFITDDVINASKYLYLADCVLGTGRSLMEAMSIGIPSLTPLSNFNYPILVENKNFESLSSTNFSERNVATKKEIDNSTITFKKLVSDKKFHQKKSKETIKLFNDRLSVKKVLPKYMDLYTRALSSPKKINTKFINWLYYLTAIKDVISTK